MRLAARGAILASIALAACQPPEEQPPAQTAPPVTTYTPAAGLAGPPGIAFHLPRGRAGAFFDLPWPTELARSDAGRLDFSNYPARSAPIFSEYVKTAERDLDGASLAPVVYFRFESPADAGRAK